MIDFSELSLETFQVLRAYGKEIVLYDENGNRVFEPSDARRFYLSGDNILVSILEDGDNSAVKVYLSTDIQISEVLEFVTVLRRIATQFNVLFNLRKYNKQIEPKDFATQAAIKEQKEYSMNIMEGLYGTSKSSYLKLENARMIVRHSARVKENMIGGRGRAIQSIFVENAQGERFLFPVNVLSGARAMTQHVNHGGTFADEVGQQIIRMAQDFSDLSKVAGHIGTNHKTLPAQAMNVRESIRTSAYDIRRTFERMCRDEASYIRESARITEAQALTEGAENITETVDALKALLAVEGVSLDESTLETVATRVGFMEDMRPDTNPTDDATDPDDGKPVQPVQPTKPVAPGQSNDQDGDDKDGDTDQEQENGSFHESALAETSAVRAFAEWMAEFDPDQFFEGKSFKRNDDDEESAEDKKKQDKQKRDAQRNKQEPVEEGKSFKRNDDDEESADDKKKKDQQKRDAQRNKNEPVEEGKSFKRNDDDEETAEDKKKKDKQRREDQKGKQERTDEAVEGTYEVYGNMGVKSKPFRKSFKTEAARDAWLEKNEGNLDIHGFRDPEAVAAPVEEGKSFKRNKDEDADDKKKQDKQRRDDQKGKNEPVDESVISESQDDEEAMYMLADQTPDTFGVAAEYVKRRLNNNLAGVSHALLARLLFLFFKKRVEMNDLYPSEHVIHGYVESTAIPKVAEILHISLTEGKSFKRNDDDEESAEDKKKKDQQKRDAKRSKNEPVEEGKSFKRNEEDGDKKKKDDQQRRKEREDKKRTDEASDVSFNDAKSEIRDVKAKLGKMNAFDKDYVSTKARLHKLEDRLARNGDDDLDEASDVSFNDAKSQIKQVKSQLSKMSPFDKNYVSMKAHLHKLEDRLSRNGSEEDLDEEEEGQPMSASAIGDEIEKMDMSVSDADSEQFHAILNLALAKVDPENNMSICDAVAALGDVKAKQLLQTMMQFSYDEETDESYVSGDGGYSADTSDVIESEEENMQSWLENGNPVKFKVGTGYDRPGVWNPSQVDFAKGRCWVGDENDRGWYVSVDHLEPHYGNEDEDDMDEDCVIPRNMSKSLADEVEKHDDENGEPEDQAYISRLRTLAGMNKI